MSKYKFDYLVFIGRLQPPHNGHIKVIQQAQQLAGKVILVLGSADQPRTPKNPFTVIERSAMLFGRPGIQLPYDITRLAITEVRDSLYNDQKWTTDVQEAVNKEIGLSEPGWRDYPPRVGIIGHHKDITSFYLDLFPQWELVEHEVDEVLSATDLRELYFEQKNLKFLQSLVPQFVYDRLEQFRRLDDYKRLVKEYEFIKKYKQSWLAAPHSPTFVTVDTVVVQSGHVLLVQRKAAPGEGLYALPGGFINPEERLVDGAIRELKEETQIKVPPQVLKGSISSYGVFDHPNRSQRGRTITHAYLIELPPGSLPKVKGSDDARNASWWPIANINTRWDELFEDHGDIMTYFNIGV